MSAKDMVKIIRGFKTRVRLAKSALTEQEFETSLNDIYRKYRTTLRTLIFCGMITYEQTEYIVNKLNDIYNNYK